MSANRLWAWVLLLAAIGIVLWYRSQVMTDSDQGQSQQLTRVFFVTGGTDDYWQLTVKGAEAASREHNAKLEVQMPSQSEGFTEQQQILVSLKPDNIDGVAVSPLEC